jgi:rubrerythrin
MTMISRRQFLFVSGLLSASLPLSLAAATSKGNSMGKDNRFPITVAVLKDACVSEIMAHQHYNAYSRKAVKEKYPNIAYLFSSLAVSEKIHADNFRRLLTSLDARCQKPELNILISDTQANLEKASAGELNKIKKIYPEFLIRLEEESHDKAFINCMYSWKSHKQHEKKLNEIIKYCKMFFGSVSKEIEGMKLDLHVCEICGSTVDESPKTACDICNYPVSHYKKIKRPT